MPSGLEVLEVELWSSEDPKGLSADTIESVDRLLSVSSVFVRG